MVRKMNFEIIVRQVENGVIINESLIKEIKGSSAFLMGKFMQSLRNL